MKFIFSISLIIISGILFFTVANPIYKDVSDLRTEVATYNVALGNSKDLQATRDKLVDSYKNITKADHDRLEHFLPNTVNNIRFIIEVEHIANLHSMSIKNIKFDAVKAQDSKNAQGSGSSSSAPVIAADPNANLPYGTFPIEFTTEGNYSTFILFLKDLEHNLRLVDVKSVDFHVPAPSLDKSGPQVDPNIYTYNVKIETYWLK